MGFGRDGGGVMLCLGGGPVVGFPEVEIEGGCGHCGGVCVCVCVLVGVRLRVCVHVSLQHTATETLQHPATQSLQHAATRGGTSNLCVLCHCNTR